MANIKRAFLVGQIRSLTIRSPDDKIQCALDMLRSIKSPPQYLESLDLSGYDIALYHRMVSVMPSDVFGGVVPPKLTTVAFESIVISECPFAAFKGITHATLRKLSPWDVDRVSPAFPHLRTLVIGYPVYVNLAPERQIPRPAEPLHELELQLWPTFQDWKPVRQTATAFQPIARGVRLVKLTGLGGNMPREMFQSLLQSFAPTDIICLKLDMREGDHPILQAILGGERVDSNEDLEYDRTLSIEVHPSEETPDCDTLRLRLYAALSASTTNPVKV
jgi:hypothetical protein